MNEIVSVVIPIYKVEKYLKQCIESILNQTYKNLEIILVDDGSPDNCGKICDEYAKKDDRIKVIHKENGGVSSARNIGLQYASGKYVSFIDADDYTDYTMYEKLISLTTNVNTDVVALNYYKKNENSIDVNIKKEINSVLTQKEFLNELVNDESIGGYLWNKLYKLETIKNNNIKFDERVKICEDLQFNTNFITYANDIMYCKEPLYYYRQRNNSALSSNDRKKDLTMIYCLPTIIDVLDNYEINSYEYKMRYIYFLQKSKYKYKIDINYDDNKNKMDEYFKIKSEVKFKFKIKLILMRFFPRTFFKIKN